MSEQNALPCIFGCSECRDDLRHYLCCDVLWTALISVTVPHTGLLGRSPLTCLGLSQRSQGILGTYLLAMAYQVYHGIKLGNRDIVDRCVASGDFSVVHELLFREVMAIVADPMYSALKRR